VIGRREREAMSGQFVGRWSNCPAGPAPYERRCLGGRVARSAGPNAGPRRASSTGRSPTALRIRPVRAPGARL